MSRTGRSGLLVAVLLLAAGLAPLARADDPGPGERPPPPILPDGFEDRLMLQVAAPTAFAFTPEGEMLVATQPGQLYLTDGGSLPREPVLDLSEDLCPRLEQGLLGLTLHPDFADNGWLYLYWTRDVDGCAHRVSRFTLGQSGKVSRKSELVLLDRIPSPNGNHNGGDLHFGKDGYLYVSVGDGGCDYAGGGCAGGNDASRDTHVTSGKILRVGEAGEIPPDNPFVGPGAERCHKEGRTEPGNHCEETFAWGLRNPFRMAFDPDSPETRFFINDVGQDAWEEIDEGRKGADYGWNVREGHCANNSRTDCAGPPAGMTDPIYSYPHDNDCGAVTGAAFVPRAAGWPDQMTGDYLFGDYGCGAIYRLGHTDGGRWERVVLAERLGPSSAVHFLFGPSPFGQSLYYTTYAEGGEIRRLDYVASADRAPLAELWADPPYGEAPLTVRFDAGRSRGFGAPGPLRYRFDFGDGSPVLDSDTAVVTHQYENEGRVGASVVAVDSRGRTSEPAVAVVSVGDAPPEGRVDGPDETFRVGDRVKVTGEATDAEEGRVPADRLTWHVLLHHEDHIHPYLGPITGEELSFRFPGPESLRAAGTSWFEVRLAATDSTGLSAVTSYVAKPRLVDLTFVTDPEGLEVMADYRPERAPWKVVSWARLDVRMEAMDQAHDGRMWVFRSWSHGGEHNHVTRTPEEPATYTATFG